MQLKFGIRRNSANIKYHVPSLTRANMSTITDTGFQRCFRCFNLFATTCPYKVFSLVRFTFVIYIYVPEFPPTKPYITQTFSRVRFLALTLYRHLSLRISQLLKARLKRAD